MDRGRRVTTLHEGPPDRDGGDHVTGSAPSGDHRPRPPRGARVRHPVISNVAASSHAARLATLARMPTAPMVMTSEDPPKETKGSGTPVTGSRPTTAPILITAWLTIQAVMPAASSAPKRSGARQAARTPATAKAT